MNRQQAHNHLSARTVTLMPHALITGAAGGLGAAIARALAPTHSLLLGGRPSLRLDTLADELTPPGGLST